MTSAALQGVRVFAGGLGVAVGLAASPAGAVDAAKLDQLMKIIEQQQQMIASQAQTLESLKSEVQALRRQSDANANAVAAQATQAQQHEQKVAAVEQRVDQAVMVSPVIPYTDENVVQSGEPRIALKVSGQVNRALLAWSDGSSSDVYNVDNNSSGTRIRAEGKGQVTEDFSIGATIEFQGQVNSSTAVDQNNPNTGLTADLRRAEAIFHSEKYGRIYLGKGWTASDSTSEVDLSGTSLVGYSSVADIAGGMFFRSRDTNTPVFGPTVGATFNNLDGLGRRDRIRYDTPDIHGFVAAASWTSGGAWDVALRYARDFGSVKFASAVAYSDGSSIGQRQQQVNGSVSVLHDSGFNLTVSAGNGGNKDNDAGPRLDTHTWYAKGGYIANIFDFGTTNFSIDGGQDFNVSVNNDQGTTIGAQVVQKLQNYGTEFYAGYRFYKLTSRQAQYYDFNAGMAGARVKF